MRSRSLRLEARGGRERGGRERNEGKEEELGQGRVKFGTVNAGVAMDIDFDITLHLHSRAKQYRT